MKQRCNLSNDVFMRILEIVTLLDAESVGLLKSHDRRYCYNQNIMPHINQCLISFKDRWVEQHKEIRIVQICAAENISLKYRIAAVKKNLEEKENYKEKDRVVSLAPLSVSVENIN